MRTIKAAGGEAVVNTDNCADFLGAKRMVDQAIETFGGLDILVNNAGILRDRVLVNMMEPEWDAVIEVHLKGTFAPSRHAAAYWRNKSKEIDGPVHARIINTSSVSGIYGNTGQTNYGAAKAGIAAFTVIAARELKRYGVTVNAIAPQALTRMTEGLARTHRGAESRHASRPRLARGGVDRQPGIVRLHRADRRSRQRTAGHRRGLASRPHRHPGRGSHETGPDHAGVAGEGAEERRHEWGGPRLTEPLFAGLKVIDCASYVAAPAAATVLADFGADVIKIEPPGEGDPWRSVYRRPGMPASEHNHPWLMDDRNRRGLVLDLKAEAGRAVLERLIAAEPMCSSPTSPLPARERLRMRYEDFAAAYPRLIYASLTAYGEAGEEVRKNRVRSDRVLGSVGTDG